MVQWDTLLPEHETNTLRAHPLPVVRLHFGPVTPKNGNTGHTLLLLYCTIIYSPPASLEG